MKILTILMLSVAAHAQISDHDRPKWYVKRTFGPTAILLDALGAGKSQLTNNPPEWEQGMAGYSRRLASRFGQNVVQNTIELGAGWALREDPRYKRHQDWPAGKRTWHAIRSTLMWRDEDGKLHPAFAKVGGIYGGAMISMAWHPARYTATGDGVRIANIRMGTTAAANIVREFWPEIRRIFKR